MKTEDTIPQSNMDQPVLAREAEPDPRETRIGELEVQLREAEARAEEEKNRYLRMTAEIDAKRKRLADEAASKIANFKLELVRGFLEATDNLERALQASPRADALASLREGIEMTLKQFHRQLEEQGVERIDCLGQPFDPAFHEAVAVRHELGRAENEVIEVHRQGFRLGDRLVRPAQVVVNQRKAQTDDSEETDPPLPQTKLTHRKEVKH